MSSCRRCYHNNITCSQYSQRRKTRAGIMIRQNEIVVFSHWLKRKCVWAHLSLPTNVWIVRCRQNCVIPCHTWASDSEVRYHTKKHHNKCTHLYTLPSNSCIMKLHAVVLLTVTYGQAARQTQPLRQNVRQSIKRVADSSTKRY